MQVVTHSSRLPFPNRTCVYICVCVFSPLSPCSQKVPNDFSDILGLFKVPIVPSTRRVSRWAAHSAAFFLLLGLVYVPSTGLDCGRLTQPFTVGMVTAVRQTRFSLQGVLENAGSEPETCAEKLQVFQCHPWGSLEAI